MNKFAKTLRLLENQLILKYDNDIIFNNEDTFRIRKDFKKNSNQILEEAFNKKYNRNTLQRVPKWLWVVLAFFAYDNVLNWLTSPLIMIIVTFISIIFGWLYINGFLDDPSNIKNFTI